MQKLTIN